MPNPSLPSLEAPLPPGAETPRTGALVTDPQTPGFALAEQLEDVQNPQDAIKALGAASTEPGNRLTLDRPNGTGEDAAPPILDPDETTRLTAKFAAQNKRRLDRFIQQYPIFANLTIDEQQRAAEVDYELMHNDSLSEEDRRALVDEINDLQGAGYKELHNQRGERLHPVGGNGATSEGASATAGQATTTETQVPPDSGTSPDAPETGAMPREVDGIFENPSDDPDIQAMRRVSQARQYVDKDIRRGRNQNSSPRDRQRADELSRNITNEEYDFFVEDHPDKAEAYADKEPEIAAALERRAERDQAREAQAIVDQTEADRSGRRPEVSVDPEAEAKNLSQQMEDLGTRMMLEISQTGQLNEEDLAKFQEMRARAGMLTAGFTPEQARNIAKRAMGPELQLRKNKELRVQKEVSKELQRLMALEMQILTMPKRINELKKQREDLKGRIQSQHSSIEASGDPQEQSRKKMEIYPLYMQLANTKAEIVKARYAISLYKAEYKDVMQHIRRRLGVTGGFGAYMEWAGAKVSIATANTNFEISNLLDSDED